MLKFKNILLLFMLSAPYVAAASDCCDTSAASCTSDCASDCGSSISKNLWQPHSFSNYALQDILILQGLDCSQKYTRWVNKFGFAVEYMQNFGSNCHGLGAMPFWSGTNSMTIGNNDGLADLDAFQFGMGTVETVDGVGSTITLCPKVQHVGSEFLWYIMQNENKPGFYAKVKAPLGAMIITTPTTEIDSVENDSSAAQDALVPPYPIAPIRFDSVTEALHGGLSNDLPLYAYGQLACQPMTTIRFGDISIVLGANVIAKEHSHLGFGAKFSCPTGNVPQARYILEPIFGRAGHWGAGAEMSGHYTHERQSGSCLDGVWTVWVQAEAVHLFAGRQPSWRSFDLKANGPGSKYLLLEQYQYDDATGPDFTYQTTGAIIPAINITTLPVNSTFAVEGNFALLFDYTKNNWNARNNWNVSVGGEFWFRSAECLSIDCCSPLQERNNLAVDYDLSDYAVMGRQIGIPVGITWCEPKARINKSVDYFGGASNPPPGVEDASLIENRIPSDFNKALDIAGAAAARIFTGKVIGEFGYTWADNCYAPHVSIFGGAELADKKSHWVNLWSVGLQASLQF